MNLSESHEPVLTVASITAGVTAIIGLLVAFGLDLTEEQRTAILSIVAVVAPLIVVYARKFVTPVAKLPPEDKQ